MFTRDLPLNLLTSRDRKFAFKMLMRTPSKRQTICSITRTYDSITVIRLYKIIILNIMFYYCCKESFTEIIIVIPIVINSSLYRRVDVRVVSFAFYSTLRPHR